MTDKPQQVGDLEVHQDLEFEKRQWRAERIGWLVMLTIVIAALLGAFGRGPLSKKSREATDASLSIDYDRFARLQAQTEVRLTISEDAVGNGELRLWLDRAYLAKFEIREINPEPERIDLSTDRAILVYRVPGQKGPLKVNLNLEPIEMGTVEGVAGVEGSAPVDFNQFVYP
jgi:hypothetical protein